MTVSSIVERTHQSFSRLKRVTCACCVPGTLKTDDSIPWPLRALPVTRGGGAKPTVRLTDFGGKSDGVTDNLPAFKEAFAALARASGGTLIVPREPGSAGESVYLTLPPEITVSNVTLILEAGTRVQAKTDTVLSHEGDWPTVAPWANGIDGTALQWPPRTIHIYTYICMCCVCMHIYISLQQYMYVYIHAAHTQILP